MKHSRASLRYAKALYAAASEKNAVDAVQSDLASIQLTLSENNELVAVLESPVASSRVKRAYLDQIFTDLNPLTSGLLNALVSNERLELLQDVIVRYAEKHNEGRGAVVATLKSSSATTAAFDNEIIAKIKASGYSEVTLEKQIAPELVGGFVLRINDLQFDASLSKQLNRLKREFSNSL